MLSVVYSLDFSIFSLDFSKGRISKYDGYPFQISLEPPEFLHCRSSFFLSLTERWHRYFAGMCHMRESFFHGAFVIESTQYAVVFGHESDTYKNKTKADIATEKLQNK